MKNKDRKKKVGQWLVVLQEDLKNQGFSQEILTYYFKDRTKKQHNNLNTSWFLAINSSDDLKLYLELKPGKTYFIMLIAKYIL